ncbi:unnamed protein product, partial [Schistocephalus solidus]|uniref:ADH_N domain-containing protein n=1 Tax=Schistocephalus solidus TaxID=70667 RepID=A0A183TQY2_SCHSO
SAGEHVSLVVARVIRPQTPDIIRTASGDIVIDYGADCTATTAGAGPPALVPPVVGPATLSLGAISPPSLKSPSTRLCREQASCDFFLRSCPPFLSILSFLSGPIYGSRQIGAYPLSLLLHTDRMMSLHKNKFELLVLILGQGGGGAIVFLPLAC